MASWFSKVFKGEEPTATIERQGSPAIPKPRRVVQTPVTFLDQEASALTEEISIKAKIDERAFTCTFLVDRPVLEGHSCWVPNRDVAEKQAPLAKALFDIEGVWIPIRSGSLSWNSRCLRVSDGPKADFQRSSHR